MPPLKICFVAAEMAPFAKTGGLGDVSAALPRTLHRLGHDVRPFLPLYRRIEDGGHRIVPVEFLQEVPVRLAGREIRFSIDTTTLPGSDLPVYLVRCPALYDRPGIYTADPDEPIRFAMLTRAAIESCQRMGWGPDLFHANDWHTALLPLYLRARYEWDRLFERSRTVLTLHNVGYQGVFSHEVLGALDLADAAGRFHQGDLAAGRVNFLKTGLLYSDCLTTVSPTHAHEIQTPAYGMGLEDFLARRSERLVGILNGIDTAEWDPATDPLIPHNYSLDDLSGKAANKAALGEEMGLAIDPGEPALGIVTRLVRQKGIELLAEVLPGFLAGTGARLFALGSGEPAYEEFFASLERRFPRRAVFYRGYNNELAHRIEASADLFLMPSLYEPCGLNQMYSLRYGTPPLVRKTGGLADSVVHFDRSTGRGTGFVFEHADATGLGWALGYALEVWRDRDAWRRLQANGMPLDFSWERQASVYVELYRRLLRL